MSGRFHQASIHTCCLQICEMLKCVFSYPTPNLVCLLVSTSWGDEEWGQGIVTLQWRRRCSRDKELKRSPTELSFDAWTGRECLLLVSLYNCKKQWILHFLSTGMQLQAPLLYAGIVSFFSSRFSQAYRVQLLKANSKQTASRLSVSCFFEYPRWYFFN